MILYPQFGWGEWGITLEDGQCVAPSVWHSPAERVSEVLGPDGEPIMVGFERPRMGFDLTPKGSKR